MKPLPYTRELCDRYQSFKMQVDELNGLKSGLIRIGTFSSVATHWLPKIIREFQKDYPNIDYELLLGDYTEIEEWVAEGRVDCGFLRLPANGSSRRYSWSRTSCLRCCPRGTHWASLKKYQWRRFAMSRSCSWKRGQRPR